MVLRIISEIVWWIVAVWFAGFATLGPLSGEPLDSAITVGQLVAFLVVFGLMVGLGKWTARIASRKGRDYLGWSYYGLLLPYIALPHAFLLKSNAPATMDTEAWDELNRAISDRSLYTASLRDLRRYHRAAIDRGVVVPPGLIDTIQRLISQRESRRQLVWTMVAAVGALAAVIISLVSANWPWNREPEGARLRRECTEIVREAFKNQQYVSDSRIEAGVRECILQRGFAGRK